MNIDDAPQASTSNMLDLTVSHGGQQHQLSIAASATLVELQEALYQATQVAPASQKLIYKGKPLISPSNVSSTLSALNITNGSKLLLIGAKDATVSAFVKEAQDLQKRLEISKWRPTVKPRSTPAHGKMVMDLNDLRRSGNNAYGRIEVLPNCPHEDLRKDRLIRLSKDEAVLDCMKRREWTVGLLTELHPHRDPTLLGLNKNAGEAIYLRLLTDDLSGLRPYFHTRMVLLHELTHNKHGDHDEKFKTLNSLLNKEVKAFEAAKKAGAHRLGGDIGDHYEPEEVLEEMCGSAGPAQLSPGGSQSPSTPRSRTPSKMIEDENGAWEMEQRRLAILRAAEQRSKKSTGS
ncbi:WLM-domain-containing protein [Cystobasidium minutum MCA 4210]|uniref:WLM-domain-containing protein n=1 Tax=Cystobasidium minutum MCA 4210 TaxID=1397322 RepID=UPI0034CDA1F2|eukprot:jgi/Rhomi1/179678/fgenesh1_pg.4_\